MARVTEHGNIVTLVTQRVCMSARVEVAALARCAVVAQDR